MRRIHHDARRVKSSKLQLKPRLTCQCAACWKHFPAEQTIYRNAPQGDFWLCFPCDDKLKSYHTSRNVRAAWGMIGRMVEWVEGRAK